MPIYEYHCGKCAAVFEEIVNSKEIQVVCPECGSSRAQRMVSACSLRTGGSSGTSSASSSSCAGCSGKNCSTCH